MRRTFRCPICSQREYPDRKGIQLCNECLERARTAIQTKTPIEGLILFRTYSESKRCPHADSETVLVALDDEYDFHMADSYCDQCSWRSSGVGSDDAPDHPATTIKSTW